MDFQRSQTVLDHLVCNVMNGHRIDGDKLTGIEQITDGRTIIQFEGDLAEPVAWSGTGGFCVEKDERAYPLIQDK